MITMTTAVFLVFSSICCLFSVFAEANQQCPAGFYCPKVMEGSRVFANSDHGSTSIPCPAGTFSELGQNDCTPCEPGYYANKSGSASCYPCQPGFMCKEANQNPVPCPRGTYSSCTGQTCCSGCSVGTYTPNTGSIQCVKCPAGDSCPTSPKITCGGDLLSAKHQAILSEFTGKQNLKWKLIYKATRDGFQGKDFHRTCDGQRQTMTIIQSKSGYLFGGYADAAWDSSNGYVNDPRSFIFTLTNPNSILPTRYLIKGGNEQNAFYNGAMDGPIFGQGNDILVYGNSNVRDCHTFFPYTYTDTTGKGGITFTGNVTFQASEIEVYKLLG